jgi:hypothetical protein
MRIEVGRNLAGRHPLASVIPREFFPNEEIIMPNRGTNQDQQQTGRRNPTQTTPDDDEEEVGDPTQMEEAGNLRPRDGLSAAPVGEAEVEDEETEGDEDEEADETEDDESPLGGRV